MSEANGLIGPVLFALDSSLSLKPLAQHEQHNAWEEVIAQEIVSEEEVMLFTVNRADTNSAYQLLHLRTNVGQEGFLQNFELDKAQNVRQAENELIQKQNQITDSMLQLELYHKLGEYILEKDVSGTYYTYRPIGSLREKIEVHLAE